MIAPTEFHETEYPEPLRCTPEDLPARLLANAKELWNQGHVLAAGMVCRAAIERHVNVVCRAQPGFEWIGPRDSVHMQRELLVSLGVITRKTNNRLAKIWGLANRICHVRAVTTTQIGDLLRCTEVILQCWTAPPRQEKLSKKKRRAKRHARLRSGLQKALVRLDGSDVAEAIAEQINGHGNLITPKRVTEAEGMLIDGVETTAIVQAAGLRRRVVEILARGLRRQEACHAD